MNKLVLFFTIAVLTIRCNSGSNLQASSSNNKHYMNDWIKQTFMAIDKEIVNIPDGCPPLRSRIDQFKEIIELNNIKNNKNIIDSLIISLNSVEEKKIVIVDRYSQGFNFSHCTTFMIYNKKNSLVSYLKGCRTDPDPSLVENSLFITEKVSNENKIELNEYLKMRSDCNLDAILIVTIIDAKFYIEKIKVILMPS